MFMLNVFAFAVFFFLLGQRTFSLVNNQFIILPLYFTSRAEIKYLPAAAPC